MKIIVSLKVLEKSLNSCTKKGINLVCVAREIIGKIVEKRRLLYIDSDCYLSAIYLDLGIKIREEGGLQ